MSSRLVWLLAIASFINYIDRGNLATAAPLIQQQLSLSNAQLGLLMSAFFWSYIPGQFPAGWLTERLGACYVLAGGVAIWGIATGLTGAVESFTAFLVLRVILGVGESAMYPATCVVLAEQVPDRNRGAANGLIAASVLFGPSFGVLAGGMVMSTFGWRPVFLASGALTLLWLWPWLQTRHVRHRNREFAIGEEPSLREMLRQRKFWGACLGHFALAYAMYQVMSWLPIYLIREHGMSVVGMAKFGGICYLLAGLASIGAGWATDRWCARGASSNLVRKLALVGGLAGVAVCMICLSWKNPFIALGAMIVCSMCIGVVLATFSAAIQVMAGPQAAGRWMGLESGAANLAGLISPIITGRSVDESGSFSVSFLIAACVAGAGSLCYGTLLDRIEPINWSQLRRPSFEAQNIAK